MKKIYIFLSLLFCFWLTGCVDDEVTPEPPVYEEPRIDPNIPEEIRNGFSITFTMELPPLGDGTRVSNTDLLDIDNYVDLEKVRVLFFVCAADGTSTSRADTTYTDYYNMNGNPEPKKPYMSGVNDHFLFESKSRWVSTMTGSDSDKAQWQVTAPVFTYGNNDEYRWDDIRYALTHYPFKVVVMANRPDVVEFGNFDSKFKDSKGNDINVTYNTGRGPLWGPDDTWIPLERRTKEGDNLINWNKKPIINDLHHCQWDVVYASKNTGDKDTYASEGVYDFIIKNPDHDHTHIAVPNHDNIDDPLHKVNNMGALSVWSKKENFGDGSENSYILPDKIRQAIPMYGVQVFDPIPDWAEGTPYNISDRHHGQSGQMIRKNIFLLRSLVKLELIIPKWMQTSNGQWQRITVEKPYLRYSNVMARCEPLDVATPTERLWHDENWNLDDYCEWKNIYDYGPVINGNLGDGSVDKFQRRMAWFYGAWRDWWHFNDGGNTIDANVTTAPIGLPGGKNSTYFDLNTNVSGKPYPRIYNPVIQRNDAVRIDNCLVDQTDDDVEDHLATYHFVVYTGERNINDPTKFGTANGFNGAQAQVAYFKFNVRINSGSTTTTYFIPISEYQTGGLAARTQFSNNENNFTAYRENMALSGDQKDWNMPLLRNHTYTFTVRSIGSYADKGGLDVKVVSTEKRIAPSITFK